MEVIIPTELDKARETIKKCKRIIWAQRICLKICAILFTLTLVSGLLVLYTGKFPPIELNLGEQNFGSVYGPID